MIEALNIAMMEATYLKSISREIIKAVKAIEKKGLPILRMIKQQLLGTVARPKQMTLVDLKDRTFFSSHPFISDPLIKALQAAFKQKNQALVFLNRRGSARAVVCSNCGWQAICPRCSTDCTLSRAFSCACRDGCKCGTGGKCITGSRCEPHS